MVALKDKKCLNFGFKLNKKIFMSTILSSFILILFSILIKGSFLRMERIIS